MKKFFICMLGLGLVVACTKELPDFSEISSDVQPTISEVKALSQFSSILSKAVFGNESLRVFIKEEALKQFDNDYDVFYPYVKNSMLSCGRTFREILLDYSDDDELKVLETSLPKLTILVPDFSWVSSNCFSVNTWNTSSSQISVGYDDKMDSHPIYVNGECGFELKANSFPSFPVLIVKSNERLNVISAETKSSAAKYSFVDPIFDNSNSLYSTKSSHIEGDLYNSNSAVDLCLPNDNFISESDLQTISPESIAAYNEFGSNNYLGGVQRDYIFYGMSSSNTNHGTINYNMRDLLYRFTIIPSKLFIISDDHISSSNSDPDINETFWTGRDDRPDFDEVVRRFWSDGNFEIKFDFYASSSANSAGSIGSLTFDISPNEIMYISECHYTFDWNFWGNNWSSYSLEPDDIKAKWYYPGDTYRALSTIQSPWNLATISDNIWIKISEVDVSATETISYTQTFKTSTNVNANESGEYSGIKSSLGISHTDEQSNSYEVNITKNETSDDVDEAWLNYVDNVITDYGYYSNHGYGYQLELFGGTSCLINFIPVNTYRSNEIRNALYNRAR